MENIIKIDKSNLESISVEMSEMIVNNNIVSQDINKFLSDDLILEFFKTQYFKDSLYETTVVGNNALGIVDDGTGAFFGNVKSYKNHAIKKYEVFGMKIIDFLIDNDEQMTFQMGNNTGMYDATEVTNFPKGNIDDVVNIDMDTYKIWKKRLNVIVQNLGYKFVEFINNK